MPLNYDQLINFYDHITMTVEEKNFAHANHKSGKV